MKELAALMERLNELEAENSTLKSVMKVQREDEDTLPTFTHYDSNLLVTIEDAKYLQLSTVDQLSVVDIRSIVRLFNIKPVAQHKAEPNRKGRGTHLYLRSDFKDVLSQIEEISKG